MIHVGFFGSSRYPSRNQAEYCSVGDVPVVG